MKSKMIRHIVCAVRGGIESQETVNSAINLALKYAARLTFFHVVDRDKLSSGYHATSNKTYWDFSSQALANMHALCTLAREQGLSDVDFLLRRGNTRRRLCQMAVDTDAELIVMGHPKPGSAHNVFGHDEFHQFLAQLDLGGELRAIQVCFPSGAEIKRV